MKLERLIKTCVTETYRRVWADRNLSDTFPIKKGLDRNLSDMCAIRNGLK